MKNTSLISLLSLAILGTASVSGAVLFNGNYFQDFNSLQNTPNGTTTTVGAPAWNNNSTLAGWYGGGSATLSANYAVSDGSLSATVNNGTVGVGSFGTLGNPDRALAPLKRNNLAYVALALTNNTGATLTELEISYRGEQWRDNADSSVAGLDFSYQIGATGITGGTWTSVSALNFTGPSSSGVGQLDGNLPANSASISSIISSISLADGETIWLRWQQRATGNNGSHVAIDNVSVIPEPSTYAALFGLFAFGLVAWRRRR